MSWLSGRRTTVRDDMAYCMLGIPGIQMDVRYGEEEAAFLRLQEQLLERFEDESNFAWTHDDKGAPQGQKHTLGVMAPLPF